MKHHISVSLWIREVQNTAVLLLLLFVLEARSIQIPTDHVENDHKSVINFQVLNYKNHFDGAKNIYFSQSGLGVNHTSFMKHFSILTTMDRASGLMA